MTNFDLRSAGQAITNSGLVDDVRRDGDTNRNHNSGRQPQAEADQPRIPSRKERQRETRAPVDDHSADERDENLDDEPEYGDDEPQYREDDSQDDDADEPNPDEEGRGEGDEDADADGQGESQRREPEYEVTINGQKSKVPVSELVAGYQRGKDYANKTQALAARNRELTAHHTTAAETYSQRLRHVSGTMQGIEKWLVGALDDNRLAELRRTDPQQWIIAREEINDRLSKTRQLLGQLYQEQERHDGERQKAQKRELQERYPTEMELLRRAVPDWMDANGQPKTAAAVAQFLEASGFAKEEYGQVIDHRMLTIAYKAMRYDQLVAKRGKGELRREAKPLPRVHKAGKAAEPTAQQPGRSNRNAFARDVQQARKSGDMRDAGRAIAHLLER